MFQQWCWPE